MKKRNLFSLILILISFSAFYIVNAADEPKPVEKSAQEPKKEAKTKEDLYENIELFADVFAIIKENYVDEIKDKDLIYGSLKGMCSALDDHSQFLDPDAYKELQVDTKGEFGGVGIEIAIRDGLLTVISPIEDTPAWKSGVKAGDRIVKINGELTKDITLMDAVKKLRGDPGTKVSITVLREDSEEGVEVKDISITREIIKVKDIKEARELEDKIGYLRLAEFREHTPEDLDKALKTLVDAKIDSLILDLRNNPGGLLDVAVKVTEKFIESGKLVVYTQGRKEEKMSFHSKNKNPYLDWPMVVLVNGGSASASEIVAGCLQDYHRAIILGEKSFGKGSVQTVVPLRDNSGLRLTTSKYYTPSGRTIHGDGIHPDVVVKAGKIELKEAKEDIFEKIREGKPEEKIEKEIEVKVKSEEEVKKEEALKTDNQLVRAIDLIKGIRVFKKEQSGSKE